MPGDQLAPGAAKTQTVTGMSMNAFSAFPRKFAAFEARHIISRNFCTVSETGTEFHRIVTFLVIIFYFYEVKNRTQSS